MPGYNCHREIFHLTDSTLEVLLGIDELRALGTRRKALDDALLLITTELVSWGILDEKTFQECVFVPELSREILSDMEGEKWNLQAGLTVQEVYKAFRSEFENLRKVLLRETDVDLERAKKFCLSLNRVGLAKWSVLDRGFA